MLTGEWEWLPAFKKYCCSLYQFSKAYFWRPDISLTKYAKIVHLKSN